jgi:hypothetical protein
MLQRNIENDGRKHFASMDPDPIYQDDALYLAALHLKIQLDLVQFPEHFH